MSENKINVPFHKASITQNEENAVLEVLRSGWLTTGKYTLEFEKQFSKSVGGDEVFSLAVNSNTSGMILAMEACGVNSQNAIITTPYTFVSTATCAKHLDAKVYFADIEKDSYNIDPQKIEEILKKDAKNGHKIRAIVPVHIAGNVCKMNEILQLAKKYSTPENKIFVIEDAAHSFPSKTELGYAGTIGDVGVFSFYVTKTITTAEGGMICTKNPELAKRMTVMRMHGMDRTTWDRYTSSRASWEYDIVAPGYKFNLPDVLSALGCCQLSRANLFFEQRKRLAKKYNEEFSTLDFIILPPDNNGNAWHLYLMRLKLEKLTISREEFAKKLQEKNIGISVHFIPLFHFTYWKNLDKNFTAQNYPNCENQYNQTISLPLFPDMTDEQFDYVVKCVKSIGKEFHKN